MLDDVLAVADHLAKQSGVRFGVEAADCFDVPCRVQSAIADGLPQARPDNAAREWIGDPGGEDRFKLLLVESDDCVGLRFVVRDDDIALEIDFCGVGQFHGGAVDADELGPFSGVSAHADPVGAHNCFAGQRLSTRLGKRLSVDLDERGSRGVEPLLGPGTQVPARRFLESNKQVIKAGVAECVALEVDSCAFEEGFFAHVGDELTQRCGTLGVGDAVEGLVGCFEIDDVGDDRVGGWAVVVEECPRGAAGGEGNPGFRVFGCLRGGPGSHVLGKRFLEPQIVPPDRGDEVTEPHVAHFVQDRVGPAGALCAGRLATENVLLGEGDKPRVLHGTEVVFGYEHLVVLAHVYG